MPLVNDCEKFLEFGGESEWCHYNIRWFVYVLYQQHTAHNPTAQVSWLSPLLVACLSLLFPPLFRSDLPSAIIYPLVMYRRRWNVVSFFVYISPQPSHRVRNVRVIARRGIRKEIKIYWEFFELKIHPRCRRRVEQWPLRLTCTCPVECNCPQ